MAELSTWLLEPLGYGFFVRALLAASIVGAVCAVVGCFVVLRGMAFFGDALAHAILPGVALGYLLGGGERIGLFWGGLGAALLAALAIAAIGRRGGLKEDSAIGVVFAGMFALGILLISTRRGYAMDLSHILFGNVLGVSAADLARSAGLGALVLLAVLLGYKELVLVSFDEVQARTLRLPVPALNTLLLALIALTVVISLQTVGVALLVAMLVTPAAAAYLVTRSLPAMMATAAAIGVGSGILGLYGSYHLSLRLDVGVASGAAIVLVSTAAFALAFLLSARRGA